MPKNLTVFATGGTIAGIAGSATAADYRAGQIDIGDYLKRLDELELDAVLTGHQIASIDSVDIGPTVWRALHTAILAALDDTACDGVLVTHGTDTLEETAFLLDLTLPTHKPVVIVGAMRAADAVGYDGLRNVANAVRVASNTDAAGRGVLVVMGDRVFAARDARKVRTRGADAFNGFPRASVALVTPASLDWFGAAWRRDTAAQFAIPEHWPDVPVIYVHAALRADEVGRQLGASPAGVVVAGSGEGNMPEPVRAELVRLCAAGLPVVRASRVEQALVDREAQDDANGFVAARALTPVKARLLLQVLLAGGVTGAAAIQAAFDGR